MKPTPTYPTKRSFVGTGAWIAVAGLALLPAVPAFAQGADPARVEVNYRDPSSFSDAGNATFETERQREANLSELRNHIEQQAQSVLPPGYSLQVTVTDVNLAGEFEPWRTRLNDVRIVRDFYPPEIELEYTLTNPDGQVVKQASTVLRDRAFLQVLEPAAYTTLRYEKSMIDRWLRREVAAAAAAE